MISGKFRTSDGVDLHFTECGSGSPIVLIHGWSQTADQFRYQIPSLSSAHHVIAYDQRGHGASDKPEHGYRVHRLAADLREFLVARDLNDITLLGHSMGCSVIWAYLELFGEGELGRLIFVDEPPCLTVNPDWNDIEKAQAGALFSPDEAMALCNSIEADEGSGNVSDALVDSMLTPACPQHLKAWMAECNRSMPRRHAATLMRNHANMDWRDTISRIRLPTLAIGAHASLAPATCMPWVATRIPGARLEMFGADEGGSHFMFVENPEKFNAIVLDFLRG